MTIIVTEQEFQDNFEALLSLSIDDNVIIKREDGMYFTLKKTDRLAEMNQ